MIKLRIFSLLATTLAFANLSADWNLGRYFFGGDHQFFAGPEIYHAKRKRAGGTCQDGTLYGIRAGYDYIGPCKVYLDGEVLYSKGTLDGRNGFDDKLKSRFTDFDVVGRVGFNFQQGCGYQLSFIPFVGYGYSYEINKFIKPSPLAVKFDIDYTYVSAGFLSQMTLNTCWTLGFNLKTKIMVDSKNRVSEKGEEQIKMLIKNKVHYRLELPLTYRYCENIIFAVEPFYEFRHYGHQANFPFDFLETKLNLYGATLKFIYSI